MFLFLSLSQIVCFLLIQCANAKDLSRIINGTDASKADIRYTVSIRFYGIDYKFGAGHNCGGSLIAPDIVLSASHCFAGEDGRFLEPNLFYVAMGNLNRFERNSLTVIRDIVKILTYFPKHDSHFNTGDIALLYLNESVPTEHPILKPISINRSKMPAGTMCHVNGWGVTENKTAAAILKSVYVPIVDFNACERMLKVYKAHVMEGMLCAGYSKGQRDSCVGDSGGPLICNNMLTGIVSWGPNVCGAPLYPGVYSDVSFYSNWIDSNLIRQPDKNNTSRLQDHYVFIIFLIGCLVLTTHKQLFFFKLSMKFL